MVIRCNKIKAGFYEAYLEDNGQKVIGSAVYDITEAGAYKSLAANCRYWEGQALEAAIRVM